MWIDGGRSGDGVAVHYSYKVGGQVVQVDENGERFGDVVGWSS